METVRLSVPTIAHSSTPVLTSKTLWNHSSVLAITCEHTTSSEAHSFSQQDKQIFRTLYADIYRETNRIQNLFATDPSQALNRLAELNQQFTLTLE